MNQYLKYLLNLPYIKEIISAINNQDRCEISKSTSESSSLVSLCLKETGKGDIVVVSPNIYQAQKIYDSLSSITDNVFFYPKDDFIASELLTESFEFELARVSTLEAVFDNPNPKIIITNLTGVLSKVSKKEVYYSHIISLKKSENIRPINLLELLVDAGYKRGYTVEKQGDVAMRGSVLDIFPINSNRPFRLDFFGDEIETIKELDSETQRSKGEVSSIVVMPKTEIFFSEEEKATINFFINDRLSSALSDKTREKFEDDLNALNDGRYFALQKYLSLFIKENYSFIDYIPTKIICFFDYESTIKQEYAINDRIYEYLSNYDGYISARDFLNRLDTYAFDKEVYFTNEKRFKELGEINLPSRDVPNYNDNFELFFMDLLNLYKGDTILLSMSCKNLYIIQSMMNERQIKYHTVTSSITKGINIYEGSFIPLDFDSKNLVSITEEKIFKGARSRGAKYSEAVETKRLKSVSELKVGDYVVHYNYGIGQFIEIIKMTIAQRTNDCIHIKYAKDESLYIPVEDYAVLSKYVAEDGFIPKLSSLGSKEWEKTKSSARKKAADLAQKLLNIYSKREDTQGYKYLPDDETQQEFEEDFKYELTPDQASAIEDTKKDMEAGLLMDRLVCGDVGFGKTEVALRAAFKAILSGKQVAVLAPTTILARQHYYTFKERMDKFGVEVSLLNRFVSTKDIKKAIKGIESGRVDVVVGTHRLLSKDVKFHNLGLLIIDEEQRFGVEAKEKLKEIKANVDVLTLTATPIPRTLQMAITGIKNISLIETPPKNRYPIQTYVLERNDYIVKDAIERELSKGGQVFYLYNRVETINNIALYVHDLVKDARIAVIHGQMDKTAIEDTIESFINKDIDVLISTTLIENGIDIPNVNTLIIHDADRYGLSQLYQIKGRVGRSDKISYAYLMYDKDKTLTEDAAKRLKAIKDFTELGSGFKIAVRDLTTRGAGEILGREQSGFINKVGVELYLKMLDEEVKKLKGTEEEPKTEENIHLIMSHHIDKDYISDDYALVEIHTKISTLVSEKELLALKDELTDRFGEVKEPLTEYMYSKLTENLLNKCKFERVENSEERLVMVIGPSNVRLTDAESLFKYANNVSKRMYFYYKAKKIFIVYESKGDSLRMYQEVSRFLENSLNDNLL